MMEKIDPAKIESRLFIDNEFVNSASGWTFETVNPATEEVICKVQEAGAADVDRAVSFPASCLRRFLGLLAFSARYTRRFRSSVIARTRCLLYTMHH